MENFSWLHFYSGFRYTQEQREIFRKACAFNESKTDDERRHCVKYSLSACNFFFEIPPEYDEPNVFPAIIGP